MRTDNPELILFRCVCHSLHPAAGKAYECLPTVVYFLVKETHSWFPNSLKKINAYQSMYRVLEDGVPKKVPGLATTRWLSRLEAVIVIIDQWDALKLHFRVTASKERCHTTQSEAFHDDRNNLYLLFVRKVLKEVNRIFQS